MPEKHNRIRILSVSADRGDLTFRLEPYGRVATGSTPPALDPTYRYDWGSLKRQVDGSWVDTEVWHEEQFLDFLAAHTARTWTSDDWQRLAEAWLDGFWAGRRGRTVP